jgi:MFS family permease
MINDTTQTTYVHNHCSIKCISWSAVLVGGLIGIGLSFLLNLFSVAIGLTAFTTAEDGATAFAVGGFLGFVIGAIVSMFAAGWVAGYLGRPYCNGCNLGALYGFVAWCITFILGVMLSAPIGNFVSSNSGFLSNHQANLVDYTKNRVGQRVAASASADETANAGNVQESINDMGKAGLALFALFFLGAFASCVGGHCGMNSRKCCPTDKHTDVHTHTAPRV